MNKFLKLHLDSIKSEDVIKFKETVFNSYASAMNEYNIKISIGVNGYGDFSIMNGDKIEVFPTPEDAIIRYNELFNIFIKKI